MTPSVEFCKKEVATVNSGVWRPDQGVVSVVSVYLRYLGHN